MLCLVTERSEDENAEALFATYEAGIVAEVFPFGEQRVKLSSSTLFRQRNDSHASLALRCFSLSNRCTYYCSFARFPRSKLGEIKPNESSNPVKFDKEGEFNYHCKIHGKTMSGVVVVKPAGAN